MGKEGEGRWLGENGLHTEHLTRYEQELDEILVGNNEKARQRIRELERENRELSLELSKEEKALAEKEAPRKLTEEEEEAIESKCCSTEYKDKNLYEIHALLLDKGIYLGSVSSFHRILRKHGLMKRRNNSKPGRRVAKPLEKKATRAESGVALGHNLAQDGCAWDFCICLRDRGCMGSQYREMGDP